ncbi:hypothetical protein AB835_13835 [Candidatus Endobugula sertula]|uniref:Condensation domain-containing protein n=1 Tax=Candidatus Endobugula sertula TaxID=62101 RepID=A0A1D2QLQ4_9GAMM|nr:hypothetical protein AB835_13835 [Candidatus Endobugula sertula]
MKKNSDQISKITFSAAPLSKGQLGLWYLHRYDAKDIDHSAILNLPYVLSLKGPLEPTLLVKAVCKVVEHQPSLRTCFCEHEGKVLQKIASAFTPDIPIIDIKEHELKAYIDQHAQKTFDLSTLPVWSSQLLRIRATWHIFLINIHHIIFDGISISIFLREVADVYTQLLNKFPVTLPPLPLHYSDFSYAQSKEENVDANDQDVAYWKQKLEGSPQLLELATDKSPPASRTNKGAVYSFTITGELLEGIKKFRQSQNSTMFKTMFAAFNVVLSHYSNQQDFLVGVAIAGRDGEHKHVLDNIIGFFVKTAIYKFVTK